MDKINPIISCGDYTLEEGERISPLNNEVLAIDGLPSKEMFVTNYGRVFKTENNNLVEATLSHDHYGYTETSYHSADDDSIHKLKTHRAVLGTFEPLSREEMRSLDINHIKGKEKDNNNLSNLEWVTHQRNIQDAVEQGLMKSVSDDTIRKIMQLAEWGVDDAYISKLIGNELTPGTILQLRTGNGEYGKRLEQLGIEPIRHKIYIPEEKYEEIYRLVDEGRSDQEIADIMKANVYTIKHIRRGTRGFYKEMLEKYNRKPTVLTNKITDDTIREIIKLANEGVSDNDIATKLGLSLATTTIIRSGQKQYIDRITALGLTPVRISTSKTITDDAIRDIIRLAKEGKTDREISKITGLSKASIETVRIGGNVYASRLSKLGLEPVKAEVQKLTDKDYIKIMEMVYNGKSDKEIAAIYNKNPNVICDIRTGSNNYMKTLNRLGLTPVNHPKGEYRRLHSEK